VKKITAILLLTVYLLSNTELCELCKINLLVKHYHQTNTAKQVGFLSFLVMHYITDDFNSEDNDQDKQLPFKSPETFFQNCTSLYTTLQYVPAYPATRSITVHKADVYLSKDRFVIKDFKSLVWHPPKIA
jgi:hypothetical protein